MIKPEFIYHAALISKLSSAFNFAMNILGASPFSISTLPFSDSFLLTWIKTDMV
jgi:hypothetical protein